MSLLLAPYNNAMRLGQGFNSYTQQICVDDAVVVDPQRAENVVTNDGTTMRIIAQSCAKPSAWTRQSEVVNDQRAEMALTERDAIEERAAADVEEIVSEPEPKEETPIPDKAPEAIEEPTPVPEDATSAVPDDAEVEKSDSGSIEKIEREELVDDKDNATITEASPASEAEAISPQTVTVPKSRTGDRSKRPESIPQLMKRKSTYSVASEAAKTSKPQGTSPVTRTRSSSVGGKRDTAKPEVQTKEMSVPTKSPAFNNKVKGALAMSKVSKATELRRQREAEAREKEAARREAQEQEENERLAEQRAFQKEIEQAAREEERTRRAEAREEEKKIREEKRQYEAQRRQEGREAIKKAAEAKSQALTLEDLAKIRAQNEFVERFNGMGEEQEKFSFDPTAPRGPSQTVIYSSRFVDKLSDVTDDMSVSGSLSIKAAKIGGSGRGSFVDSDKFKESDLNFYISVKVTNQTLNFKDALVYNPLRSVDQNNFQQVYGDSFISGFLEGGEFNAIVSMKILNKAKMTDIKAEAKVAFTAGPIDVTAEANVGIARSNIETNTETTIQVSWCGGGHIKPMEQQWDIKSLMQAAARFPDLVADCPQRTYAILTKYDSLRSFVARKPASYTPLQYENAQIYTNALLDSFMTYKSVYKRLGEQIFNIQGKTLEIVPWAAEEGSGETTSTEVAAPSQKNSDGLYPYVEDVSRFEATMKGLSEARRAIRRQMARIVNEVDVIEKDPKLATDEDHQEPFQSPVTFETRLPVVEIPKKLRPKSDPLTGKRIMAKTQTEEDQKKELEALEDAENLPSLYSANDDLANDERAALDKLKEENPGIGQHLRVSSAVGDTEKGASFTNLDFLRPDWEIQSVKVEVARGAIACIEVTYDNGLILKKGKSAGGVVKELSSFLPNERITYASLEYGELPSANSTPAASSTPITGAIRVLAVRLYTNFGRRMLGQAAKNVVGEKGTVTKDDIVYEKVRTIFVDSPFQKGTFRGFFGRCDDQGVLRLGLIWGNYYKTSTAIKSIDDAGPSFDYSAQNDGDEAQALKNQIAKEHGELGQTLAQKDQAIQDANKNVQTLKNELSEKEKALQDALIGKKSFSAAQGGKFTPSPHWNENQVDMNDVINYPFPTPYKSAPRMLTGLTKLDQAAMIPIRVCADHHAVTPTSFTLNTRTFGNSRSYKPEIGWMALPENDIHFETGVIDTYDVPRIDNNQTAVNRVNFNRPFDRQPTVVSWFYEVNMAPGWHSLKAEVSGINQDRFNLAVKTWANRSFDGARVGWLAFDDTGCSTRAKAGVIDIRGNEIRRNGRITFEGSPFSKQPSVFLSLMEFDAGDNKNLRLLGQVVSACSTSFDYDCGTWASADDHQMDHAIWVWIALE